MILSKPQRPENRNGLWGLCRGGIPHGVRSSHMGAFPGPCSSKMCRLAFFLYGQFASFQKCKCVSVCRSCLRKIRQVGAFVVLTCNKKSKKSRIQCLLLCFFAAFCIKFVYLHGGISPLFTPSSGQTPAYSLPSASMGRGMEPNRKKRRSQAHTYTHQIQNEYTGKKKDSIFTRLSRYVPVERQVPAP